ncbi:MAG TPA: Tn3 family transposase [Nitrospira sp.]|nr:Tn3 family transposase [Nitrospira sp.]HNA87424.1 Tn3 family transposase [Nitrospira sp.]
MKLNQEASVWHFDFVYCFYGIHEVPKTRPKGRSREQYEQWQNNVRLYEQANEGVFPLPMIQETAYPRFRSSIAARELTEIYTPSPQELALAEQATRGEPAYLGFLILLKTFQRLGYFVPLSQVPKAIVEHIAAFSQTEATLAADFASYDSSGTRQRHLQIIRQTLQVQLYGKDARHAMLLAMSEAARTKEELADLINVGIEELVRKRYELPAFDTLARGARHVRSVLYRQFYRQVDATLGSEEKARIETLFVSEPASRYTPWNTLKQEPGSPTLTSLKIWLARQVWLAKYRIEQSLGIPDSKIKHFAAEAKTLDAARMFEMEPQKRLTLAASLLKVQSAQVLDDLAEMLIKRMSAIHQKGKEALAEYRRQNQQRTDGLIQTLRDMVTAYRTEGTAQDKIAAMETVLPDQGEAVLQGCEDHMAYAGDNYYSFLWRFYKSHRATLFRVFKSISVTATTQDKTFEEALSFLLQHEHKTSEWLAMPDPCLDLDWVPGAWWRLVTEQRGKYEAPKLLNRRHFEVCVFSQLMQELKSGDLCIPGSDRFSDYRDQLISWEDYHRGVAAYGEMVGIPTEGEAFVEHMKARLAEAARATDDSFPDNAYLRIENGEPVLRRPEKAAIEPGLRAFEQLIADRLEPANLLDVLRDTEHWLHWTRFFGPISGHDAKLDDPISRYLLTTFCYGCQLGPAQTARSLGSIDRRALSWVHWRHITEEGLDKAIREVINAYSRFALPKHWGTGKHASVDGTKWNLYEQNLLSEYHIRYGGYGGIGYYHVSDTYIALFSHFIPCGVWEAVYLLDGLLKNTSDIQPDTIHGDTQAQNTQVFALAVLLGFILMPRIRNWKDLKLYRPDKQASFAHIDPLFSDTIDWHLIRVHLPDMLRVVLSIKAGRITASTLLRKLGAYSKRNRLYQAFRELGRAIRTEFLLKYLGNVELRTLIQAATNKSEAFNGFTKWIGFGGEGTITTNNRDEQRKSIKYNHLVANCVIFHNVFSLSRVLHDLRQEGYALNADYVAALSPYLTLHINRFGNYELNWEKLPPELSYDLLA